MKQIKRSLSVLILILLVLFGSTISTAATATDVALNNELSIPEAFDFSENDICTEHKYFLQATACDDGMFIVSTHYIDPEGPVEETFSRQYIDIYNRDGKFYKELSFVTTQPYVTELTATSVNIYFYSYVVSFDLETEELHCYDIADTHIQSDTYEHLRQKEFSAGQWNYFCTKGISEGYTKLMRQKDDMTQIVVEMPGMGSMYFSWLYGIVFGTLAIGVLVVIIKRRRSKGDSKKTGGGKTGDGSLS